MASSLNKVQLIGHLGKDRKRRRASTLRDAMKIGPPVVLEEGRWDDGRGVGI